MVLKVFSHLERFKDQEKYIWQLLVGSSTLTKKDSKNSRVWLLQQKDRNLLQVYLIYHSKQGWMLLQNLVIFWWAKKQKSGFQKYNIVFQ